MSFDDNYNLKLLYSLAGNQPYRQGASHVVPESEFEISYPLPPNQEFIPLVIPQLKK